MQFFAPTPSDDFEPWERDTAEAVVRGFLRGRRGLSSEWDEDALVQECLTEWWLKRDRYDSSRGANRRTFMNRVCVSHLRSLARAERAQKRGGGQQPLSLDLPVTEDGDPLADLLADDAIAVDADVESRDLASRLEEVRRQLPDRQRAVLDGLADERTIAGLARELGVSRGTLYEDIQRIRQVCRDAGLEEFLR